MKDDLVVVCPADIEIKARDKSKYMVCPDCGKQIGYYGGFGSGAVWQNVGKYTCCRTWYASPTTGRHYERTGAGLREVTR